MTCKGTILKYGQWQKRQPSFGAGLSGGIILVHNTDLDVDPGEPNQYGSEFGSPYNVRIKMKHEPFKRKLKTVL